MNDREGSRIADITDGTSNTLMVSEDANRPQLWVKGRRRTDIIADTSNYPAGLVGPGETTGGVWAEHQKAVSVGGASADGTTTIGGGPCALNCTNDWEIYSMHPGGGNGLFADGSVRFLGAPSDRRPRGPLQPGRRRSGNAGGRQTDSVPKPGRLLDCGCKPPREPRADEQPTTPRAIFSPRTTGVELVPEKRGRIRYMYE